MKSLRKKLLASVSVLSSIVAVTGVAAYLGLAEALGWANSIALNIKNTTDLNLILSLINAGFLVTLGMFTITRWFAISDKTDEQDRNITDMRSDLGTVLQQIASHTNHAGCVSEALTRLLKSEGAKIVNDEPGVWQNFTRNVDSFNATLLKETNIIPQESGRFSVEIDKDRVFGTFYKRAVQDIRMSYVIFIPRQLGFGKNPLETLMRLIFIIKMCRYKAATDGNIIRASLRLFLVDAPRPVSSFFLTVRQNGQIRNEIALEYFRSVEPGVVDTPTAEKSLIEHHSDVQIGYLRNLYDLRVAGSAEIKFETAERIVEPLLPVNDTASAPSISNERLQSIVDQLYNNSSRGYVEDIENGDHWALRFRPPSVYAPAYVEECATPQTELTEINPQARTA